MCVCVYIQYKCLASFSLFFKMILFLSEKSPWYLLHLSVSLKNGVFSRPATSEVYILHSYLSVGCWTGTCIPRILFCTLLLFSYLSLPGCVSSPHVPLCSRCCQDVCGYQRVLWRVVLCHLFTLLTVGLPLIIFHWRPKLGVQAKCRPCPLYQADCIIIRVRVPWWWGKTFTAAWWTKIKYKTDCVSRSGT